MATSFLRFCRASSDGVAFMVGALGFECAAGVCKIYAELIGGWGKL